jgi:UDP-GlcNAc3NAcA epimerase
MAKAKPIVVSVVGARPQFIKLAALLRKLDGAFDSRVAHTGQHFDPEMSEKFFAEYQLPEPDINLNVGRAPVGRQLARMIDRMDKYFGKIKPAAVLVFGDTTSTMAGALAASVRNIPTAHIEAGLRSFDLRMAEEKNRVVADHLSRWLFCPTREAVTNLKAEAITSGIYPVGDIMAETFRLRRQPPAGIFDTMPISRKQGYYYVTLHRAEAVDDPDNLRRLIEMIGVLDKPIVFPVHPRTRKNLRRYGLLRRLSHLDGLYLLPPVNHHTSLWLIANAHAVFTDSGGVQKEAYWARVRCFTVRTVTEWGMLVDAGYNELVGFSRRRLKRAIGSPFKPRKLADPVFARKAVSTAIVRQLKADLA